MSALVAFAGMPAESVFPAAGNITPCIRLGRPGRPPVQRPGHRYTATMKPPHNNRSGGPGRPPQDRGPRRYGGDGSQRGDVPANRGQVGPGQVGRQPGPARGHPAGRGKERPASRNPGAPGRTSVRMGSAPMRRSAKAARAGSVRETPIRRASASSNAAHSPAIGKTAIGRIIARSTRVRARTPSNRGSAMTGRSSARARRTPRAAPSGSMACTPSPRRSPTLPAACAA